ncbi:MAG TPA: GNAT family N-acetyltransferase, partial [Rhodocyclaceae bacterium]
INLASGKLVALFVHPEFSGQQVGQLMLECLLDRAASAGCDVLKLDSSLNAANFYRRHGFTEVGRSKYRTQGGVHVDSIQMERVLRHATSGPSSQAL